MLVAAVHLESVRVVNDPAATARRAVDGLGKPTRVQVTGRGEHLPVEVRKLDRELSDQNVMGLRPFRQWL